jgi:ketosteroid isomerase-like protein
MLGDPLPPSLAAYYDDLDAGRMDDAARWFTPDVVYALPPAGEIETNPRVVQQGRDAVRAWFHRRGRTEYVHDVQLCVDNASSCLVEGVVRRSGDGQSVGTFVASVQLDGAGLISRYLAYMCTPATDPPPTGDGPAPADADKVLHEYFAALDRGDFDAAADRFSADVVYAHPPYRHTGIDGDDRVVFRGRDELLAAFQARGKQRFDHAVLASIQRGPHCLIEGAVRGLADGGTGSFVSSLTLDGDGRIQRYLSFYCEPAVPRAASR